MLSKICNDCERPGYQCSDKIDFCILDFGSHQRGQAVKDGFENEEKNIENLQFC